jgi:bacillithiol biosynthesis cysteine-adding enzyme BshC
MPFATERVPLEKTGLLSPFIKDYLYQSDKLQLLYSFPAEEKFILPMIEMKKNQPLARPLLYEILMRQYQSRKPAEKTLHHIRQLTHDNTFTVTCAHQPTLLLHPAFFFHKIASTLALCNQFNELFPRFSFVPVFWLGSEDHDLEELGKARIFGKDFMWQTSQKGAVGRFMLDDDFKQIWQQVSHAAIEPDVSSVVHEAMSQTNNFGEFTAYVVQQIFAPYGLVVVNQDDAALKKMFVQVMQDEVLQSRAEKILQPTIQFLSQHYKVTANVRSINIFYLGEHFRERLVRHPDNQYEVIHQSLRFSVEELMTAIAQQPENFSPNVILRPLFQSLVLPDVAFVGGSAECSYWLEQKALFDFYQVVFPLVVHRVPVVVLPQPVWRKMKKLGVKTEQVFAHSDTFIKNYLKENFEEEISLARWAAEAENIFHSIEKKLSAIDSTLSPSVKAEKQKCLSAIAQLEKKALKAIKRKSDTALEQLNQIHQTFFPGGILQERYVNFFDLPEHKNLLETIIAFSRPFNKELLVIKQSFD